MLRPRLEHRGQVMAWPLWLVWREEDALSPAARLLRDVMRERAPGCAGAR